MRFRTVYLLMLCLAWMVASPGCALDQWWNNDWKVGPEYCKPLAPVATDWIDIDDQRVSSDPTGGSNWWQLFDDPVMERLVLEAADQNLNLREAGLLVLEARARRGIAVGGLFPQVQQVNSDYSRTLLSQNTANTPAGINRSFSNWAGSATLLWEFDFWGRFRRAIEAADADLDASVENYDDVLNCLLAEVAATYVNIRTLQKQLQYSFENIEIQKGSLGIAEALAKTGATSEVDVRQAEILLAQTRSTIPRLQAALRRQNNLLCFLLGRPSEDLLPSLGTGEIPTPPMGVVVGIPGDLLRRRPDVRRSERAVAAQSARIGVAVSDLYPHLSIAGTIGWQAQSLSSQFSPNANFGIVAPTLSWDVLNYGRFRNNIAAQQAAFEALALSYQNAVLNANREVEDQITNFLNAQERTRETAVAVNAAQGGVELVTLQYENGAVNYNTVFNLQLSLNLQQNEYAVSQGDIALSMIGIYKALGGGWQIRCDDLANNPPPSLPMEPIDPVQDDTLPPPPSIEPDAPTEEPQPEPPGSVVDELPELEDQ